MKNIKWLISHQPEYLFLRTAKAFAKMLEEVNSEYKIEILTTDQYKDKYDANFTRDQIVHKIDGSILIIWSFFIIQKFSIFNSKVFF